METMWQDKSIAVGQWILVFSLAPSLFGPDKPAFWTSIITCAVSLLFACTFFTLKMRGAVLSSSAAVLLWSILAYQQGLP